MQKSKTVVHHWRVSQGGTQAKSWQPMLSMRCFRLAIHPTSQACRYASPLTCISNTTMRAHCRSDTDFTKFCKLVLSKIWQFALIGDQRNKKRKEYACWRSCRQTSKAAAQNMLIKRTVLHMRDSKMYCPAAGFAMQILKKGKEKHTPFCANSMRSQALYRAAQGDTGDKLSN